MTPGPRIERTTSTPSPVMLETAWTGTSSVISRTSATFASTSSARSLFVSRTTGWAPLSRARIRYRSRRRRFRSSFSDVTMKTTSRFAASTCSSVACHAVLRENFVRRGRIATIVPASSVGRGATATQSPTTGRSAGEDDSS